MKCQGIDKDKKRVFFDIESSGTGMKITNLSNGESYFLITDQVAAAMGIPSNSLLSKKMDVILEKISFVNRKLEFKIESKE